MGQKIWRPISDISQGANISPSAGSEHYAMVEGYVADDDGTTLQWTSGASQSESLFGHTDDPIPNGSKSIRLYLNWRAAARGSSEGSATTSRAGVRSGASSAYANAANDYVGEALVWTDHESAAIANDPATEQPWTVAGINAAELIIGANGGSGAPGAYHLQYVTQEFARITYVASPTGTFDYLVNYLDVSVDAGDVTPEGGHSITDYDWDWGDGSEHGSGETAEHSYAGADTYSVTLTVTYDTGETFVIIREITTEELPPPGGAFTVARNNFNIGVNAGGVTPPEGITITDYAWDWGDGSAAGSGARANHRYAAGGRYTITLTVTYDTGDTFELTEEVTIMTITDISPMAAERGESGDLITIQGTGFGASQGYGTVEIGGVEAIIDSWSDTEIECYADDNPATPLGAQDVVVTDNGGDDITDDDGIIIYDSTDNKDETKIKFLMCSRFFVDGLCVGLTGPDGVSADADSQEFECPVDDAIAPVLVESRMNGVMVSASFRQLYHNGELLAAALGGSYDDTTKRVKVLGDATRAEHTVMWIDSAGCIYVIRRCIFTGTISLTWNKDFSGVPVRFRSLAKSTQELIEIDLSALLAEA